MEPFRSPTRESNHGPLGWQPSQMTQIQKWQLLMTISDDNFWWPMQIDPFEWLIPHRWGINQPASWHRWVLAYYLKSRGCNVLPSTTLGADHVLSYLYIFKRLSHFKNWRTHARTHPRTHTHTHTHPRTLARFLIFVIDSLIDMRILTLKGVRKTSINATTTSDICHL